MISRYLRSFAYFFIGFAMMNIFAGCKQSNKSGTVSFVALNDDSTGLSFTKLTPNDSF